MIPAEGIGILTDALINALINEFIYASIHAIQDIFIDMIMGIFNDVSMKT